MTKEQIAHILTTPTPETDKAIAKLQMSVSGAELCVGEFARLLERQRDAALAENERLRSALKAIIGLNLEGNKLARHPATHIAVVALRAKDNHLEQARQLLADTTDAVAGMQNEVHAKTL